MSRLIIGCGNPDRGDDAAGLLVARKLHGREHSGDMLSLLDLWDGFDEVVIIDAMLSGAQPGTIHRFNARDRIAGARFLTSTHDFGLTEAIELARSLGQLPPSLTVYGIEAADCAAGAPVSREVLEAVATTVGQIRQSAKIGYPEK